MAEAPFDVQRAHRWFAVEFNNRAWDLVELPGRSPGETSEMIDAAHATRIHWGVVGTPVNQLRAECLLATAYAAARMGQLAVHHAEKCLEWCQQVGDEQSAFDQAAAHGCAANAYATLGDRDRAKDHYGKLAELAAQLADDQERALLSKLYPAPGW
jgi:hypothetical protein